VLLATILNDLRKGDGKFLSQWKQTRIPMMCKSPLCERNPWSEECYSEQNPLGRQFIQAAIVCSDGSDITKMTSKDWYQRWQTLNSQSKVAGGFWTGISMSCGSWDLRPTWEFNKPITANSTAHPILWLSNTRDPVTPLRNAEKMSTQFPGSVVFVQDADGHCTISQPSLCVMNGYRKYFQTGELPKGDVKCKPDQGLFGQPLKPQEAMTLADAELLSSAIILAEMKLSRQFPLGII